MSDHVLAENQNLLPPTAPPLSTGRLGQLQKIIAPWGRHTGSSYHAGPSQGDHDHASRQITNIHTYSNSTASQNTTYRAAIPIAALDINRDGTHAVLAGKEILKTIRVQDRNISDALNIRAAVGSRASAQTSPQLDNPGKRREYLPARDVKWSTGDYSHIIATAATSGRISLYDVNRASSRLELAWLHEHTNQINKLDFDPFAGYLLLSASQDKSVRLWDLREGTRERSRLRFEPRIPVRDVRWSPTDPLDFAICTDGGVIQKWDARSPLGPKLSINGHEKACYSLDWHPDGRHVVSGGFDRYIRVWDFQNDNKRQKPVFQLRAPSGIRNIRWRPAYRTSETTASGLWHSTQIAVSYNHDDPRIHIWDLRRPWLPFRELDRSSSAVNDLVWATTDKLWTVGDEGDFIQWDLQRGSPFYNDITPCISTFAPDGEYYMFSESRELRRASAIDDPAVGFLSISRDKLSSGEDPGASRSFTDDEAALDTNIPSAHRRVERGTISKSTISKSQANSPPSLEEKSMILTLDKAVFRRQDLFNNEQVGAASFVLGIAAEPQALEFLATHYATPATAVARAQSPGTILERLATVFQHNAMICDAVSMHRMAQSWRILGAVIVPELKNWADANRSRRREEAAKRREALEHFRSGNQRSLLSPLAGLPSRGSKTKADSRSQNLMTSLLKATVESDRPSNATESTSNMTTPLAMPARMSPAPAQRRRSDSDSQDEMDDMLPLPPSVLSSHSTAAAAARALIDSPGRDTNSSPSSPEVAKRPHKGSERRATETRKPIPSPKRNDGERGGEGETSGKTRSTQGVTQEDRRAALRDYRIQARPIFSLERSSNPPIRQPRQDSGESFQMFSASADSSQQGRSLGQSFGSTGMDSKPLDQAMDSFHDLEQDDDEVRDLSLSDDRSHKPIGERRLPLNAPRDLDSSTIDSSLDMSLGTDASAIITTQSLTPGEGHSWNPGQDPASVPISDLNTALSSTPEIFEFERGSLDKPRIYTSNPLRAPHAQTAQETRPAHSRHSHSGGLSIEELDSDDYLIQDFRPIDLFHYEPQLPFAWSSLPLICQSIAFDVENGSGHSQFAAHLIMHVHPYFFHSKFRQFKDNETTRRDNLADRLMTPHLGHRVIEGIFASHISYLEQAGLWEAATLLRNMCVELDYPRLYAAARGEKEAGSSLHNGNATTLSIACSACQGPMTPGKSMCDRCLRVRSVCPVCLSLYGGDGDWLGASQGERARAWGGNGNMWIFCHACGHSGHVDCMSEWFAQPLSNGSCPTQGCGCDCGPGVTRESRLQQQILQQEEVRLIRGMNANGSSSTKRDSLRAGTSPAVDKVRAALRTSIVGERATQSGDERSLAGRRSTNQGNMPGLSNPRKSVRLVTPGEEDSGQATSRS